MPSVMDATMIDVWKLRRDGTMKGGVTATYQTGDITLKIRREGQTLHIHMHDSIKWEIPLTIRLLGPRHIPIEHFSMHCPKCRKGVMGLFLYEDKLKCRFCHNLKINPLSKVRDLENRLAEYEAFIELRKEQERLGKRATLYFNKGNGASTLGVVERNVSKLKREIAEERLRMYEGATAGNVEYDRGAHGELVLIDY
jgi:hypothetical protein